MVRVSLEVREGADQFEVTARADTISQAVGFTEERFPGGEVRVVFPIDGDEFFGADGTVPAEAEGVGRPVPGRAR